MIRIGVVGFCHPTKFDYVQAWSLVKKGIEEAAKNRNDVMIVGGLTDVESIHRIGYYIARQQGWNCGGIACEKAKKFAWFPMSQDGDVLVIEGTNWGDESERFLNSIDVLVRVGGGPQAHNETKIAKERNIPVYEYELGE